MCYTTKHLYVTKAQRDYAVPRPGNILPSFLPYLEADCLMLGVGQSALV